MSPFDVKPRVFISYARSDGEAAASELRSRLEAANIPLWRDRESMEGGRDWWLQITEALDHVEFMVLIMTEAALHSQLVRREWRYARQRGAIVYPVIAESDLDFGALPRWMRTVHFYDLEKEWTKFINDLNTRPQPIRVPFMAEDLPPDFIPRPAEYERLISYLLNRQREEPIAITTALRGVGGYGKTMLARALCHDEAIQNAFDDGILWVTLGEKPGDLTGRVEDLIFMLSGQRPGFSGVEAATAFLVELLAERDILIVIDDVWNSAHLEPFLQGGSRCARLITTRTLDALPVGIKRVDVDTMRRDEAVALLGQGLPAGCESSLTALASRLGEWPLLLKLVNSAVRDRVLNGKQTMDAALAYINKALNRRGLTFFDVRDPSIRQQAVAKTLGLSIGQLGTEEFARFEELAIFPEDVAIPLSILEPYWSKTGGYDELDVESLCDRLNRLSLVLTFDPVTRYLRLHDIIRQFLLENLRDRASDLHGELLEAARPASGNWADLTVSEPYFWDHLFMHLQLASRNDELLRTIVDLRYLAAKTLLRTALAVEADIALAEQGAPEDIILRAVRRSFVQCGHILNRCEDKAALEATLYSRLKHVSELVSVTFPFAERLSRPRLEAKCALPDLPHPALIRTLGGHWGAVLACAIGSDGITVVSAGTERLLKVWNSRTGKECLSLEGHTSWVRRIAISPDGTLIVSASYDRRLRIWDAITGELRRILIGHTDGVTDCAISPDGKYIASASLDGTVRIWDAFSGITRFTLARIWGEKCEGEPGYEENEGHWAAVRGCAISPDGALIVSASSDERLIIWDAKTWKAIRVLSGHGAAVNGCSFSHDGSLIASAGADRTIRLWECRTGNPHAVLDGHRHMVVRCAFSPDDTLLASASADGTVRVWDIRTGEELQTIFGHTDWVNDCAFSPDGSFIISASSDGTVKIWDAKAQAVQAHPMQPTESCASSLDGRIVVSGSADQVLKVWDSTTCVVQRILLGHDDSVRGCAVSRDGRYIVSASADKTISVWDGRSGERIHNLTGHKDWVNSCAINVAGDLVASVSNDRTLRLWDLRSRARRLVFVAHTEWINSCAFSPDDAYVVSASADGILKRWDLQIDEALWESWLSSKKIPGLEAAERLLHPVVYVGHTSGVNDCAFAPDGTFLVSASDDCTLRLWNISTGASYLTLAGHKDAVTGCAVSPNSSLVASVSRDGAVKIWDVSEGNCLMTLNVDGDLSQCAWICGGKDLAVVGAGGVYFLRIIL